MKKLNEFTKRIILATSKKSYELFVSLARKKKNKFLFSDIRENDKLDIIDKEDIFDSFCDIIGKGPEEEISKNFYYNSII